MKAGKEEVMGLLHQLGANPQMTADDSEETAP